MPQFYAFQKNYAKPIKDALDTLARLPVTDDPKAKKMFDVHKAVFEAVVAAINHIEGDLTQTLAPNRHRTQTEIPSPSCRRAG